MWRWWDTLYGKRPQVDAKRSGLGCLLAAAGLVGVCALIAIFAGQPLVLGRNGEAQRRMALNGLAEMDDALRQLLQDAGVNAPPDLFPPATLRPEGSLGDTAETQGRLLRALLRDGSAAELDLLPGLRARLAPQYLSVRNDPWGRPYFALLTPYPGTPGPATLWLLLCTGPNGVLDDPAHGAGDDLTYAGPPAG